MHRARDFAPAEVALVVLLVVTTVAVLLALTRAKVADLVWSAVCVASAALWLGENKTVEGHTVIRVTAAHGLTTGDLTAWPALVLAVGLAGRYLLARGRP